MRKSRPTLCHPREIPHRSWRKNCFSLEEATPEMITAIIQKPKWYAFTAAVLILILIGTLDRVTGYTTSFVVFYVVPITITFWWGNRATATVVAFLATFTWWWVDAASGHRYFSTAIQAWEVGLRCVFFLSIALIGSIAKERHIAVTTRISLLEHARRLEHQIVEVSEYEQQRIGQDLHDGLCQYLAALGCSAAALKNDLEKSALPNFAAVAGDLADSLRAGISQTRNLARGLMPVRMETEGLVSALEELTSSAGRLLGVQCVLNCTATNIPSDISKARHLYRITQEAINNATRHGKARRIEVSLSSNAVAMVLSIADDGIGISKTTKNLNGMGLSIMRYRANLLGGELSIEEPPGGGTVICCTARST